MEKIKLVNSLVNKAFDTKVRMEKAKTNADHYDIEKVIEGVVEKATCIGRLEVIQELLDEIE